jgi:hypothetical protein
MARFISTTKFARFRSEVRLTGMLQDECTSIRTVENVEILRGDVILHLLCHATGRTSRCRCLRIVFCQPRYELIVERGGIGDITRGFRCGLRNLRIVPYPTIHTSKENTSFGMSTCGRKQKSEPRSIALLMNTAKVFLVI